MSTRVSHFNIVGSSYITRNNFYYISFDSIKSFTTVTYFSGNNYYRKYHSIKLVLILVLPNSSNYTPQHIYNITAITIVPTY